MRALFILVLALWCQPAFAAISEQGSGTQRAGTAGSTGEDSRALAFPGNVSSGCLLIVGGTAGFPAPASISVTDSVSTSYTVQSSLSGGDTREFIAFGVAASSGANTVTVNPAGSSSFISFGIDEFCGNDATPLDVNGGNTTGTSATASDGITTVANDALVIGVMANTSGQTSITPAAGWTQIAENEDLSCCAAYSLIFQIVGAAGAYTPTWNLGASINWNAQSASFKPFVGAGGGGGTDQQRIIFVQ